jgi:hypothetical protein
MDHAPFDGVQQTVLGWETSGYNFVMRPGDADTVGAASPFSSNVQLWGPGNGSANGLTISPTGGNYLMADGGYQNGPITQELHDLTPGQTYRLDFYWAAAQQYGYDGATTQGWTICFGTCKFSFASAPDGTGSFVNSQVSSTTPVNNADHGFVPWQFESMTFTAKASDQTLALLAYGSPIGQPPFALIDGLTLQPVPEPSTWAMTVIGFAIIGSVVRRRRGASSHQSSRLQIV